ncbi:MAG: BolA family transcriptional regulator [Comamonadaceae bacterium]|nr:MAG: BolA family transcriptional regulator [Comamonadaceae bacterium]
MNGAPSSVAPVQTRSIEEQLRVVLKPTRLEVLDESAAHAGHTGANAEGYGTHFRVRIASPAFAGKTRVARHRLVYDAMQNFIDQGLHALAIEILDDPA